MLRSMGCKVSDTAERLSNNHNAEETVSSGRATRWPMATQLLTRARDETSGFPRLWVYPHSSARAHQDVLERGHRNSSNEGQRESGWMAGEKPGDCSVLQVPRMRNVRATEDSLYLALGVS